MSTQAPLRMADAALADSEFEFPVKRPWRLRRFVPRWITPDVVRGGRWAAIVLWAFLLARQSYYYGVPFDREGELLWIVTGVAAASLGKRAMWTVLVDWLPLALVLLAYDYLRGLADSLGMPTWWHPQLLVDRFLAFGREPTVWLQERLKHPDVRWWDVLACVCYISFFFLPYLTAGVLWMRSRADFYRWSGRFVGLSFLGFGLFALMPAAPPWAAARCSAAQVASHPSNPACLSDGGQHVASGGILGRMTTHQPGAHPWIERISTRGFSELHLGVAKSLLDKGQGTVDAVAAVPSLHLGGTTLFVIFMWRRVNRWWRPLLAGYPVLMTFTLVYSAEHYLSDCIAGALAAVLVSVVADRIERRRKRSKAVDTLNPPAPPPSTVENLCPSTATTP